MRRWAAGFDDIFPPGVWSAKQKVMAEMIGGILEVTDEEEGPLLRLLLGLARSVCTREHRLCGLLYNLIGRHSPGDV